MAAAGAGIPGPPITQQLGVDESDDAFGSCEKRWLPSAARGTPPSPRCSHTATALSSTKFVVVGGGSCTDGTWTHFGDVHEFDVSTQRWAELVPAAGSPVLPPRRGHCAGLHAQHGALSHDWPHLL
jgi:hypothetical protein